MRETNDTDVMKINVKRFSEQDQEFDMPNTAAAMIAPQTSTKSPPSASYTKNGASK